MYVYVKVLWKRYKRSVIKKTGQVNIKRFPRYCLSGQGRIKGNTPFEYKELGFWSKLLLLPPYFEDKIKPCYGSMVLYNKSLRLLWIYLLHNHRWPNDKKELPIVYIIFPKYYEHSSMGVIDMMNTHWSGETRYTFF